MKDKKGERDENFSVWLNYVSGVGCLSLGLIIKLGHVLIFMLLKIIKLYFVIFLKFKKN